MSPLVSLIVPAYNAANTIKGTVESLLAQTHQELEVIVVDDSSTDQTSEILRSLSDPRLRLLRQSNQGATVARNSGFQESHGAYILFIDSDDQLHPNSIAAMLQALQVEHTDSIATCGWVPFLSTPGDRGSIPTGPHFRTFEEPLELILTLWNHQLMMGVGCYLMPRHLVERSGGFTPGLRSDDDGDFFVRILLMAKRVCYTSGACFYYRKGQVKSQSRMHQRVHLESRFKAVQLQVSAVLEKEDSPRTRRACANRLAHRAYELSLFDLSLGERCLKQSREYGVPTVKPNLTPTTRMLRLIFGTTLALRCYGILLGLRGR